MAGTPNPPSLRRGLTFSNKAIVLDHFRHVNPSRQLASSLHAEPMELSAFKLRSFERTSRERIQIDTPMGITTLITG